MLSVSKSHERVGAYRFTSSVTLCHRWDQSSANWIGCMKNFYSNIRDLHLYAGLFLCPFVLLFAFSTILLNHPSHAPSGKPEPKREVPVQVPPGEPESIPHAREILRQIRVTGEIDYVRHNAKAERLFIPVTRPGETNRVDVDLRAKTATIEPEDRGLGLRQKMGVWIT